MGERMCRTNTIDVTNACASTSIGLTGASRIFLGMSATSCAGEGGICMFSGLASIAYGTVAQGMFTAKESLASPVACNNTFFGDPAPGFGKACYVLSY
jgi:hypothetical protein